MKSFVSHCLSFIQRIYFGLLIGLVFITMLPMPSFASKPVPVGHACYAINCWGKSSYQELCEGVREDKLAQMYCNESPNGSICKAHEKSIEFRCGCAETCSDAICTKFPPDGSTCWEARYRHR